MNGAEAILHTLADGGVRVCFANPGTSEMHLVSGFDRETRIEPVLCLFEGVATGAADGYARIAQRPALTLLHLGAGVSNAGANLHNARRAFSPMINVIGDHATYHQQYDAPLASDIEALARPHSVWLKSARTANEAVTLAAEALTASLGPPAGVASLILPADCAWSETSQLPSRPGQSAARDAVIDIELAARALRGAKKPVLLLGSAACSEAGLRAAGRLNAVGIRVVTDTFVARLPRGAGRFRPDRLPYFGEMALAELAGVDLLLLASTNTPVAFFAYPDKPSLLVPEHCRVEQLGAPGEEVAVALDALADAIGAPKTSTLTQLVTPDPPTGLLTPASIGQSIARHLPEGAIVSEDAVTAGPALFASTQGAQPHDWLMLTGGAIGQAFPVAIGAAFAKPDAKVLSLTGDGAAAYTVQSLWTMARESLDVITVVFANHAYRILNIELQRTGAEQAGPSARQLLDLGRPRIDWVSVGRGFGVPAIRSTTAEEFDHALARAVAQPGPHLIELALG